VTGLVYPCSRSLLLFLCKCDSLRADRPPLNWQSRLHVPPLAIFAAHEISATRKPPGAVRDSDTISGFAIIKPESGARWHLRKARSLSEVFLRNRESIFVAHGFTAAEEFQ
jgi:hypothetical protein